MYLFVLVCVCISPCTCMLIYMCVRECVRICACVNVYIYVHVFVQVTEYLCSADFLPFVFTVSRRNDKVCGDRERSQVFHPG